MVRTKKRISRKHKRKTMRGGDPPVDPPSSSWFGDIWGKATEKAAKVAELAKQAATETAEVAKQAATTATNTLDKFKNPNVAQGGPSQGGRRRKRKLRGGKHSYGYFSQFGNNAEEITAVKMAQPQTYVGGFRRTRRRSKRNSKRK
jgi:hypothetical protein